MENHNDPGLEPGGGSGAPTGEELGRHAGHVTDVAKQIIDDRKATWLLVMKLGQSLLPVLINKINTIAEAIELVGPIEVEAELGDVPSPISYQLTLNDARIKLSLNYGLASVSLTGYTSQEKKKQYTRETYLTSVEKEDYYIAVLLAYAWPKLEEKLQKIIMKAEELEKKKNNQILKILETAKNNFATDIIIHKI